MTSDKLHTHQLKQTTLRGCLFLNLNMLHGRIAVHKLPYLHVSLYFNVQQLWQK